MSQVIHFPARKAEPSRVDDERLLQAIAEAERLGLTVVEEAPRVVIPFVSPFLLKPLRSEQEVRASRLHPLFASICAAFGMAGAK